MRGQKIDLGKIMPILKKKPLKMAASTIYGIQKAGYSGFHFDRFLDIDVSFCERVDVEMLNSTGGVLLPGHLPHTEQDKENIRTFVETINNDNLYT
jgi:hypothetical protein